MADETKRKEPERRTSAVEGRPGAEVREDDLEPHAGLRYIARLFKVLRDATIDAGQAVMSWTFTVTQLCQADGQLATCDYYYAEMPDGGLFEVRALPDGGYEERKYAISCKDGYPAFFVHSGRTRTLSRVERMRIEKGQPRLMTPDEFIDAVRDAGER